MDFQIFKAPANTTGMVTGSGTAGQISFFSAASVISSSANLAWDNTNRLFTVSGRIRGSKGANVASANDLPLGIDGNTFTITGNVQINGIATANWNTGLPGILLIFSGAPTVKHNTAAGAGFASMLLDGSADFTAAANSRLTLIYDGTNWLEISRTVA